MKPGLTFGFGLSLPVLSMVVGRCIAPGEREAPRMQSTSVAIRSKADTVEIVGMKFIPAEITVTEGTTIVFINNDMVAHDITGEANKAWSSNLLAPC